MYLAAHAAWHCWKGLKCCGFVAGDGITFPVPPRHGEGSALKSLHRLSEELDCKGIEGGFVECGVFQGGSAAVWGHALRTRLTRRSVAASGVARLRNARIRRIMRIRAGGADGSRQRL